MREIRFHGRGGQGVVVASRIVAAAACAQRLHVQAFPMFGPERSGAPVSAFVRLDAEPIWLRCQIARPDVVAILDPSLFAVADLLAGLRPDGDLVVNERASTITDGPSRHRVDASGIAVRHGLGTTSSPLASSALAGAVCRVLDLSEEALCEAVRLECPSKTDANLSAAKEGFGSVALAPRGHP